MKPDLRISIKGHNRKKNLKVLLFRPPFPRPGVSGADEWDDLANWRRSGLADATGNGLAQVAGEGGEAAVRFPILMDSTKQMGLIGARSFADTNWREWHE